MLGWLGIPTLGKGDQNKEGEQETDSEQDKSIDMQMLLDYRTLDHRVLQGKPVVLVGRRPASSLASAANSRPSCKAVLGPRGLRLPPGSARACLKVHVQFQEPYFMKVLGKPGGVLAARRGVSGDF